MPECPVEQAQTQILIKIAEQGEGAITWLSSAFRNDEVYRAAIKGLAFEGRGAFRRIALDTIGSAGDSADIENVLMHLVGHEKVRGRKKYSKMLARFGNAVLEYRADREDWVRASALAAAEMILMREEITAITPETERALVRCAFQDPSGEARAAAARILSLNSRVAGFHFFFMVLGNAEKMHSPEMAERGEEALGNMVKNMAKHRAKGSFIIAVAHLAENEKSERVWGVAENALLELFDASDMKKEITDLMYKEKIKRLDLNRPDDEFNIAVKRIDHAIARMGRDPTSRIKGKKKKMTAEAELGNIVPPSGVEMGGEIVPPPKQMVRDGWDDVIISRGPVVDALCAAGRRIKMAFRGAKGRRK